MRKCLLLSLTLLMAALLYNMAFTLTGCGQNASSPVPLAGYGSSFEPSSSPLPSPSSSPSPSPSVSPSPGTTGTVTGIIYDSDSYEEIQGAQVTIGGKTTLSDWVGHYEIDGLSPGTAQVTASCEGYLGYSGSMTIPTAGATTQDVLLEPPTTVSGTVTDGTTSLPLAGVAVTLGTSTVTTDAKGQYTLSQVPSGDQTVTARLTGYNSSTASITIPGNENYTQDFALYPVSRTGTVNGHITDALVGVSLGGVTVTDSTSKITATTNEFGHYTLNAVPSGTQAITATQTGYKDYKGTVKVGDTTVTTFDFTMAMPGTAGKVKGQALDMNTGELLKGVTVTVDSKNTTTDKNGSYSFDNVKKGTLAITASKEGYLTHTDAVVVEPDTNDAKCFALSKTPLRKGPYLLYNNITTAMTVLWQTYASPKDAKIEWGGSTAYGHSATVTENSSSMNEHRFSHTITGLAEGTKYYYKITVDGQSQEGSFRAAPGASAKELSFYAYGDTRANHYLWEGVNDHENVCKAIMSDMSGSDLRQTLILNDGDIVRHGLDEAYWDTQYFNRSYPGQMQLESTLPIMTSIGNHECYLSNCAGIDSVIGGQLLLKYWPYAMFPRNDRFYYSFDYGPIHVAVVDTWMHRDYTPGTDQYEWLSKDLDSTTKTWKIVFMHTPAWDCMFVDDAIISGLTPLFAQKGVRLVMAGHVHHYCRAQVPKDTGITYLALGGGGAPHDLVPLNPNDYNPKSKAYILKAESTFHFARFEVTSDAINATVTRVDATGKTSELEKFTITK
jgi:hypothetical protein